MNDDWKELANEYLKLVSTTEYFANEIIENNETISQLAFDDGFTDAYEWVEWVYDPDKDYSTITNRKRNDEDE